MDNIGKIKSLEPLCGLRALEKLSMKNTVVTSFPEKFHLHLK